MIEPNELVLRDDNEGVRLLTLNRPSRHNAWTLEMEERYFSELIDAANDPLVRAIVVTGSGSSFCPGMDAAALADVSAGGNFSQKGRIRQTFPLSVPKPIIAAINGACAGIGLVQALMCDVRFASTTAKFSTAFSRRGLPAENAVAWVLGRLVGTGVAADLLLSGRVLGADEAWRIGLVNDSVAPDDLLPRAIGYASELAGSCSPRAMADIKAQLYSSLESGLEMARRESKAVFEAARSRPDFSEGVQSLVEKRPPTFAGFSAALDEQDFRD